MVQIWGRDHSVQIKMILRYFVLVIGFWVPKLFGIDLFGTSITINEWAIVDDNVLKH